MRLIFTMLAMAAVPISMVTNAHAEVIELEGKVKSVDKDARTISVVRKTANGEKILELEVAKKAGDLSKVEEGDSVSFSYDPDLELITKIAEEGGQPADKNSGQKACRLRISMSDTGDASVLVEPIEITSQGGKTEREDLGDGVWRLTNVFANTKDLMFFDSSFGKPLNAAVDSGKQRLVLAPKKSPGSENPASQCIYPLRLRVPFEIVVDVSTTAKEGWPFIQIYAMPRGTDMERPVFNFRTKSALKDGIWFDAWSGKQGAKEQNHLVPETQIDLKAKWEKTFRLPVPNIKSQDFYTLTIGSLGPPADKTFIHRIEVKGFPIPLLGMQLEQKGDVVFVNRVVPKALAAKAGAKEGDVILSINGTKPATAVAAVELMAKTGFGDTCDIAINRGGEAITLALKPTWDD
jgi:hypothetical protein